MLTRNLLLTVHQHGGDDVMCKPRIGCKCGLVAGFAAKHLRVFMTIGGLGCTLKELY
jgi:hypothetical protein